MEFRRYQTLFLEALSKAPSTSFPAYLNLKGMYEISYAMEACPIQDSFRFRSRYLGWKIAEYLIDEKGEIDASRLKGLCLEIEAFPYPLGSKIEGDAAIYQHIASCLRSLIEKEEILKWIKKFSPPICHKKGEEIVKEALWPEIPKKLETPHIRRAALASWLTLLRQTTGSCFATAPAILIQRYRPELFFKDLYDLLSTGQLKRIIQGRVYAVPMSPNPGVGDLQRPISGFSPPELLAYAPGLKISLESAQIFEKGLNLEEKINEIRHWINKIESPFKTTEQLIRKLILNVHGISEEEIEEEEHLAKIQMTPLLAKQTAVYYQRPTERAKKVADIKRKFSLACSAFRAMTDCSLLRSWEYTVASFCEVKFDFARWNLYVGLGFNPEQKGGIGDVLFQIIDAKLQACNAEISRLHKECEEAIFHVRSIESLLQQTLSDAQKYQLKGELNSSIHAMNSAIEMRDKSIALAEALSGSFSSLIRQFDEKLQDHFQEIFDPSVKGIEFEQYEDSPAGFRLVYKHGRSDASLWTLIQTPEEYLASLRDFFSSIERDLHLGYLLPPEYIEEMITGIVRHLNEPEFLASSMDRVRSQGRLSPWEYISGGTMQTLIQHYFSKEKAPTEISCKPVSEKDLLKFLKKSTEKSEGPLLIHSPTHAFIINPGALQVDEERALERSLQFVKKWKIDEERKEFLAHRLSDLLDPLEKPLFLHLFRQKPLSSTNFQFRCHLIESLQAMSQSKLRNPISFVDGFLYENFPLLTRSQADELIDSIFKEFQSKESFKFQIEQDFASSSELLQMAKTFLIKSTGPFSNRDLDLELIEVSREMGFSYPSPLLFAETNWPGWYFGWIINPTSEQLELWRLNRIATRGFPMNDWKPFFSLQNTLLWVLLTKQDEYLPL